jgi:hypothetical protein
MYIARHIVASSSSSLPIVRETKDHIEHYTDTLSQIISRDLSNTLLTKIQFQRYVNWLLRLEKSEKVTRSPLFQFYTLIDLLKLGASSILGYPYIDHQEKNKVSCCPINTTSY